MRPDVVHSFRDIHKNVQYYEFGVLLRFTNLSSPTLRLKKKSSLILALVAGELFDLDKWSSIYKTGQF